MVVRGGQDQQEPRIQADLSTKLLWGPRFHDRDCRAPQKMYRHDRFEIRPPQRSAGIFLVSTQESEPDIRDSQINPYRSRLSCTILSRRRQVLRRNHSRGRDSNSSRRRDPCQLWGASFRSSQVGRISEALRLTYIFTLLPWSLRPSRYRFTRQRSGGMA